MIQSAANADVEETADPSLTGKFEVVLPVTCFVQRWLPRFVRRKWLTQDILIFVTCFAEGVVMIWCVYWAFARCFLMGNNLGSCPWEDGLRVWEHSLFEHFDMKWIRAYWSFQYYSIQYWFCLFLFWYVLYLLYILRLIIHMIQRMI